jgi:uncharacterized protein
MFSICRRRNMSPQETQILQDFLTQLEQARGVVKDPQADEMIARAVARQPDAAYLLVQRALLLEQALNTAKAQIAALQSQLQAAQPVSRGFLDPNTWGNSPQYRPAAAPLPPSAPVPYQAPLAAPAQAASPGFLGGGLGSLLGTAAATAAGVAGGAFLFHGIENLIGGHHGGAGLLAQQAGAGALENTTANNFLGDETASKEGADALDGNLLDETNGDGLDGGLLDDAGTDDLDGGLLDDTNPDDGLFS